MKGVPFVVLLLCLAGCQVSYELRTKTASLDFWMSQEQVRALMGPPRSVVAFICGEKAGPGWKCTLWRYRWGSDEVYIYFQPSDAGPTVNHWFLNDDGEPRDFKLLTQ